MFEQSSHTMDLVQTYPSGAEEWHCATCGRRVVMQWPPAFSMTVIEPGDEHARHSGGKGGLSIHATESAMNEEGLQAADQSRLPLASPSEVVEQDDTPIPDELLPWLRWLENADLDGEDNATD